MIRKLIGSRKSVNFYLSKLLPILTLFNYIKFYLNTGISTKMRNTRMESSECVPYPGGQARDSDYGPCPPTRTPEYHNFYPCM